MIKCFEYQGSFLNVVRYVVQVKNRALTKHQRKETRLTLFYALILKSYRFLLR